MKQTKTTILFTPGFTSFAVIKDTLGEATKGKGEFIRLLIPGYSPSHSGSWGRNLKHPQPEQRGINPPTLPTCPGFLPSRSSGPRPCNGAAHIPARFSHQLAIEGRSHRHAHRPTGSAHSPTETLCPGRVKLIIKANDHTSVGHKLTESSDKSPWEGKVSFASPGKQDETLVGVWEGSYNEKQYRQHVVYSECAAGEGRMRGKTVNRAVLTWTPRLNRKEDSYRDK